ncbi:MAG: acylphosphatase [Pirellulales bacterium]|nr:acylphosphatase [Pirellulales bacterium]
MGKEALYSGRVQGVGFRQSVCSLASGSELRGYVQNLDNGKVRLVVEGDEVDHLLQKVADFWSRHISDIQITEVNTSGMFSNFSIRY